MISQVGWCIRFSFFSTNLCDWLGKGKERKGIYIAPFIYYVYLKALREEPERLGNDQFLVSYKTLALFK